jgi:hypothetical protein
MIVAHLGIFVVQLGSFFPFEVLQAQLRQDKYAVEDTVQDEEVQMLAAESAKKDAELARLRKEIAFLRSPEARIPEKLAVKSVNTANSSTPSSTEDRSPSSIFRLKECDGLHSFNLLMGESVAKWHFGKLPK